MACARPRATSHEPNALIPVGNQTRQGECAHRSGPLGQCARATSQCAAATGQCARAWRCAQQPHSGARTPAPKSSPAARPAQSTKAQPSAQGLAGQCATTKDVLPQRAELHTDSAAPGSMRQGRMWVPVQSAGPPAHCASAPGPYRSAPGPRHSAPGPSGPGGPLPCALPPGGCNFRD